jgi:hypothetical protein
MDESALIGPDTIILTIALDSDVAQVHTFDDLKTIYELEERHAASIMAPPVELDLANWHRKEDAFDALVQASADTDPIKITRLVLSSTVELAD